LIVIWVLTAWLICWWIFQAVPSNHKQSFGREREIINCIHIEKGSVINIVIPQSVLYFVLMPTKQKHIYATMLSLNQNHIKLCCFWQSQPDTLHDLYHGKFNKVPNWVFICLIISMLLDTHFYICFREELHKLRLIVQISCGYMRTSIIYIKI
jgi:hypothetical protein